jgi:hypothetical protein
MVLDLTGLDKAPLFDRDDKNVVHLDNIEAVSAAEIVVEGIRPLVRMLLGLLFRLKATDLFGAVFLGAATKLFQNDVVWD